MDPNQLAKRVVDRSTGTHTDWHEVERREHRAIGRWAARILARVLIVAFVLYAAYRILAP